MSYEHGIYNEFRFEELGSRDWWSVACILFELLTPFINVDKNKEYEKLTYLNFHLVKFDEELKFNEAAKLAKESLLLPTPKNVVENVFKSQISTIFAISKLNINSSLKYISQLTVNESSQKIKHSNKLTYLVNVKLSKML